MTVTSTLEVTKTVTVTGPPPPSVPKTIMETDGTYRVGIDILPGTYHSGGPSPGGESDCYWARLSSLNPTDIITNNISTGPQVVMIQPSDTAFLTRSCQTWQKSRLTGQLQGELDRAAQLAVLVGHFDLDVDEVARRVDRGVTPLGHHPPPADHGVAGIDRAGQS